MKRYTILVTGGHVSPAIAFASIIKKNYSDSCSILYAGRLYAFSEHQEWSYERKACESCKIPYFALNSPRFSNLPLLDFVLFSFRELKSIYDSYLLLKQKEVDAVVVFGSYVSIPVILASWLIRIPTYLHEQGFSAGKASIFCSLFVRKIAVGWSTTVKSFPRFVQQKVMITGIPLRQSITSQIHIMNNNLPLLYITGGSTGAHAINILVKPILQKLLQSYIVYHQCGSSQYHDYTVLNTFRKSLPLFLKRRYHISESFSEQDTAMLLKNSSLLISRAGINTVIELSVLAKKAILIPLPSTITNEQITNAQFLVDAGCALAIDQSVTSSSQLFDIIQKIEKDKTYAEKALLLSKTKQIQIHTRAAATFARFIISDIFNLYSKKK
jgi:UDP-N-acetylglucosamine--N-acetylmuramyl-(pentapeptide) pyrophosphoryl-undecaprenol N-acetylglucosamine transferase